MTVRSAPWKAAVRTALEQCVGSGDLAGVLAIVWQNGEIVLSETVGHRDIAKDLPMTRDAIFQIASMTKPIVTVAALQLVDEGAMRLDDPIARWLPEFSSLRVLDAEAGPVDRTHPAPRPITLDDLLTHRSGFGYAFAAPGPIAAALEQTLGHPLYARLNPEEWVKALATLPLLSDPGARFVYGHSTEVLGCLVARIDGGTLGESLERRVLRPLGMRDTAFYVPAEKRARLAHIYKRTPAGLIDATEAPASTPLFENGGGGFYSTADDYLTFARMLLGKGEVDGKRILSTARWAEMTKNQLTAHQRSLGGLERPDFFAHTGFGYGLEVVIDPAPPLFASAGSLSWGGIFGTGWRADPGRNLVTLFLTQQFADVSSGPDRHDPTRESIAGKLRAEFEQIAFSATETLST